MAKGRGQQASEQPRNINAALSELRGLVRERPVPLQRIANLVHLHDQGGVMMDYALDHLPADMHKVFARQLKLTPALLTGEADALKDVLTSSQNWSGVDLSGANLSGADLEGAGQDVLPDRRSLEGANLSGANLQGADLSYFNLIGANFQGANLRGVVLDEAFVDGADFTGADLSEASLGVDTWQGTILTGVRAVNLLDADLHDLPSGWKVVQMSQDVEPFSALVGPSARLSKTSWSASRFVEGDLSRGDISSSSFDECDFFFAVLQQTDASKSTFEMCEMRGVDLRGANFENSSLVNCDLRQANVRGTNFENAAILGGHLAGVEYDDTTTWPEGFDMSRLD